MRRAVCAVVAFLAAVGVALATIPPPSMQPVATPRTVPTTTDPVSHLHPTEAHHSLQQPLDGSQVYWNFGGSTVLTRKFIRLTPSTQDRRGWLWNEYPLESENWEVEFKMEVYSKPHFGGDGMGFWVLTGEHDPAFNSDPDALSGNVFGMRSDYQGFGVIFDVYDNDNRRDNPAVFILRNDEAKPTNYNHDNDYMNDMVSRVASVDNLNLQSMSSGKPYTSHRCLGEFRNTGKMAKVLVKYLHKALHVYIDTSDGVGYKFCLAVQMDKSYKDYHLAFSAATGQVADNHDILEVTTRYLTASDPDVDDSALPHMRSGTSSDSFSSLIWFFIVVAGVALTGFGAYELYLIGQLKSLDSVRICDKLNALAVPHFALHFAVCVYLLWSVKLLPLVLNMPLAGYRALLLAQKKHTLNPSLVATQNHAPRLYGTLAVYVISVLLYLNVFAHA